MFLFQIIMNVAKCPTSYLMTVIITTTLDSKTQRPASCVMSILFETIQTLSVLLSFITCLLHKMLYMLITIILSAVRHNLENKSTS